MLQNLINSLLIRVICIDENTIKIIPTFKIIKDASSYEDAKSLKIAFDAGDTKTINLILTHRNYDQISMIREEYKKQFKHDLLRMVDEFLKETHGHIIRSIIQYRFGVEANILHNLKKNPEIVDVDTVIYIFITNSEYDIQLIKHTYKAMFNEDLIDDIPFLPSNSFRSAIKHMLEPRQLIDINVEIARHHASLLSLYEVLSPDIIDHLIYVFCKLKKENTLKILIEYEKIWGKPIQVCFRRLSKIEKLLYSLASYYNDPINYLISYLNEGLIEKNINKIINVITTHYQADMWEISQNYENIYKKSLSNEISEIFKSNTQSVEALLMLLGEY